jgi:hypothetical protein
MRYASNTYEAAEDADALIILTDWADFGHLDLHRLKEAMRFPIVIDGRNLYKPSSMLEQGFTYVSMGRPATYCGSIGQQGRRSITRLDPPRVVSGLELNTLPGAMRREA